MAEELYESGHLVKLYWTPTPGSQTFEEIEDITGGDLQYGGTKETTPVIRRGRKIDSKFTSPVLIRENRTFQITRNPGSAQDVALQAAFLNSTTHAFKQQGVDPSGNLSDAYIVESGVISNYTVVNPHGGPGPVRAELSYTVSGLMIIDGVEYGES